MLSLTSTNKYAYLFASILFPFLNHYEILYNVPKAAPNDVVGSKTAACDKEACNVGTSVATGICKVVAGMGGAAASIGTCAATAIFTLGGSCAVSKNFLYYFFCINEEHLPREDISASPIKTGQVGNLCSVLLLLAQPLLLLILFMN